MIYFNCRKVPALALVKGLIQNNELGKIYHFRAQYLQDWITDPEFSLVWRLKKELSGTGANGDFNSHVIDLARFLVGEISQVIGMQEIFITQRPKLKIGKELTTGLTAQSKKRDGRGD